MSLARDNDFELDSYNCPLAFWERKVLVGRQENKLISEQETQLNVLETSSCLFIYMGDCSLPLLKCLEGPLGLLLKQ